MLLNVSIPTTKLLPTSLSWTSCWSILDSGIHITPVSPPRRAVKIVSHHSYTLSSDLASWSFIIPSPSEYIYTHVHLYSYMYKLIICLYPTIQELHEPSGWAIWTDLSCVPHTVVNARNTGNVWSSQWTNGWLICPYLATIVGFIVLSSCFSKK